jgi:hypothetical protein
MEQIVAYRNYAVAKAANEVNPKGWSGSALRTLAFEIETELVREEIERGE